jgi:hypothetical protein
MAKGLAQKVGNQGFYALGPKLLVLAEERQSFTMRNRVLPFSISWCVSRARPRFIVNATGRISA